MTEHDRLAYYNEAMRLGLGSRLEVPFFTTVGKMRVRLSTTSPVSSKSFRSKFQSITIQDICILMGLWMK